MALEKDFVLPFMRLCCGYDGVTLCLLLMPFLCSFWGCESGSGLGDRDGDVSLDSIAWMPDEDG